MTYPIVKLMRGREYPLLRGHPWLFSGAIAQREATLVDGDLVEVQSSQGDFLAIAHFSPSSLALKILSKKRCAVDANFWDRSIRAAIERRTSLGLFSRDDTDSFRLVNAEGDDLPGLVVDLYASTVVLQCHSMGMWRARGEIVEALKKALGDRVMAIYDKSEFAKSYVDQSRYLFGRREEGIILENGLRFFVDWEEGQKTGFFLDQRESRALLRRYASGRDVLNAFCYSGGFSLSALSGAAKSVVSLDSSQAALDLVQRNLDLNGYSNEVYDHSIIRADFLEYMQKMNGKFDLIVLDPPAFVKKRAALEGGLKGYRSINRRAAESIRDGGLLWTFSCSQSVGRELFREVIAEAIADSGRTARILFELHQAPCHILNIAHPEGEYLKGLVLRVD